MQLTDTQCELAALAWTLARANCGMVLEHLAYPDAHELAEHGWLERRFEPNGDMSWWWTDAGDEAFELAAMLDAHASPN
jgi:hypothetical protein